MQLQEHRYQQALDFLYSFIDYSLTRNLRYSPEKFNLSRMVDFLRLLGDPQNAYKIIHIAGSKGKGSTCALLTSILTQAGYSTGFYSSPHMMEFTERIRIGSEEIKKNQLADYVEMLKPFISKVPELTTFEITTGLALKYFADQQVDFVLLEVGMGGRLDATNVVIPLLSVITTISHDHTKVLGSRLTEIAAEKAGIIKAQVPVVLSAQRKPVEEVIRQKAESVDARLVLTRDVMEVHKISHSLDGQSFKVVNSRHSPKNPDGNSLQLDQNNYFLPLAGPHQLENARTALVCVQELDYMGYTIPEEAVQEGLRNVDWPGRFEVISNDPLIIIDGAHNRDSFRKLKLTIDDYLPGMARILIFGASEDKQVRQMLEIIAPSIDTIILTQARHPRAMSARELAKLACKMNMPCKVTETVEESLQIALSLYQEKTAIIASGSIFIAGAIKEIWQNKT